MTYSIVETLENGKRLCTIAPTRWIRGNLLYWPKFVGYRLERAVKSQIEYNKEWDTYSFKLLHTDIGNFFNSNYSKYYLLFTSYFLVDYTTAFQKNMLSELTSASEDETFSRKRKITKNKRLDSSEDDDDSNNNVSKDSINFNNYFSEENDTSIVESIVKVDMDDMDCKLQINYSQSIDTNDFVENLHSEYPDTYKDFGKIKPGTKI